MKFCLLGSFLFLAIALGVLAVGQFDYQGSHFLIQADSWWAVFFKLFGEQPAFWALLIGTVILLSTHNESNKVWHAVCVVAGLFFSILFVFAILFLPVDDIYEFQESEMPAIAMAIVVGSAVVAGSFITFFVLKKKENLTGRLRKFRRHATFLILLAASEILLVNLLKILWGRPRMENISSFEEFHYWYQITGPTFQEELQSFPSGTTANGFMIIAFFVFLPYFKKIKPRWFIFLAVIWGILVALSRVVLGEHFLSDVIVGSSVTIILFFVYYHLFFQAKHDVVVDSSTRNKQIEVK